MATIGEIRQCPNCLQPRMHYEHRLNSWEKRAECGFCGFFYEKTWVSLLAKRIRDHESKTDEEIREMLRALYYHVERDVAFRMGMIVNCDEQDDDPHIMNTWFDIPAAYARRPTVLEYIDPTHEELQPFHYFEWEAISIPTDVFGNPQL